MWLRLGETLTLEGKCVRFPSARGPRPHRRRSFGGPPGGGLLGTFSIIFTIKILDLFLFDFWSQNGAPEDLQKLRNLKKMTSGALSGPLCERVVEKEHILECLGPEKHGLRCR